MAKPKIAGCVHHTIVDQYRSPDGMFHARCCKCGEESKLPGTIPLKNVFNHTYPATVHTCMAPGTAMKLTREQVVLT